jgi:hypothetical protein
MKCLIHALYLPIPVASQNSSSNSDRPVSHTNMCGKSCFASEWQKNGPAFLSGVAAGHQPCFANETELLILAACFYLLNRARNCDVFSKVRANGTNQLPGKTSLS